MAKRKKLVDMKDNRVVSKDQAHPGEKSCNARTKTRDGYCKQPGVMPFSRCHHHGGNAEVAALDLFKQSVGVDVAEKLEVLIDDALNMDNELASGKAMLLKSLEDFGRYTHVFDEFQSNPPIRPTPEATDAELESYNASVNLHVSIMDEANKRAKIAFQSAHAMIRTLSTAVHRNNKIKEGSKFQIDAKQIASILRVQLEVMEENCKGCPKLRDVLKGIQEGTKDIPINPKFSKANRNALGRRKYEEMVQTVNKIGDELYPE